MQCYIWDCTSIIAAVAGYALTVMFFKASHAYATKYWHTAQLDAQHGACSNQGNDQVSIAAGL